MHVAAAVPTNEQIVHNTELGKATTPVQSLKWPDHKRWIARLTLAQKQAWYAAQAPQELIETTSTVKRTQGIYESDESYREYEVTFSEREKFTKWWYWHYLVPLRLKRLVYKLKFW